MLSKWPIRNKLLLGIGLFDLFWLAHVTGSADLVSLLPAAYFVFGVSVGVNNAAHFTYLPELSEAERRPVTIAVFTAALGLLSGLGPMLWGLVLRADSEAPGVDATSFAILFGLGTLVCVLLIRLFSDLPDARHARQGDSQSREVRPRASPGH